MPHLSPSLLRPLLPAGLLLGVLLNPAPARAQQNRASWLSVAQASAQSNVEKAWTDPRGNTLLLVSTGAGPTTFGNLTLNHAGYALVKADAAGTWQWAQPLPMPANPGQNWYQCWQMAGDYRGGVYMVGRFTGTVTFGSGATLTTGPGVSHAYVAHYDSTGTFDWVRQVAGSTANPNAQNVAFNGLTTDASGNAYLTCPLSDTLTIGTTRLVPTNREGVDLVVAKITPRGAWQWVARSTGPADEKGAGLAHDGQGHLYVTGDLGSYRPWGTAAGDTIAQFGTTRLRAPLVWVGSSIPIPAGEGFVARLDAATGQWQWAVQTLGAGSVSGFSHVLVSPAGHVYAVGECYQSRFGPFTPPDGPVVARLSPDGAWQWVAPGPQAPELWIIGTSLNPRTEDVLFTGIFKDSLTFDALRIGRDSLSHTTNSDRLFAAALDSSGHARWALGSRNNGGYRPVFGIGIGADAQGTVYLAGHYTDRLYLGPFALQNPVPRSGALFLARIDANPTGLPTDDGAALTDLFPNPVSAGAVATWQLPTAPAGPMVVINALGQVVRRVTATGAALAVPTAGLPAGLYVLRTTTATGLLTRRLVVE